MFHQRVASGSPYQWAEGGGRGKEASGSVTSRMKVPKGGRRTEARTAKLTGLLAVVLLVPLYYLHQARTDGSLAAQLRPHGAENPQVSGDGGSHTTEEEGGGIDCDFTESRSDVCELRGDVRVDGAASAAVVVVRVAGNATFKIRPYARKWENNTMLKIRELSLRFSPEKAGSTPRCDVRHSSPAIVFSTGGFGSNFFHEIVDSLIPLFLTSRRFRGDVHFLVEDYRADWFLKYGPFLRLLSRHDVVDLDSDERVLCFPHAVVGLRSTREMGIDPAKSPEGLTMLDFKALLRRGLDLPREFVIPSAGRKPRLLFLSRKASRVLLNERLVLGMVRRLGFQVVTASPEETRNLTTMAKVVNSCDVLMGVHGAGLTNMVFLPSNASLVQIIPWGEMGYACRWSYGEPATGMGLRYADYEITLNETSLVKRYPKNHPVLKDPLSVHRQGFNAIWSVFLHQDVTLDLPRFTKFLKKELRQLVIS